MSATIIGVDPHKRSHTAVVFDDAEQIASELRVEASTGQVDTLLAWAPGGERVWAIENVNGLGHLLAQQLLARGEVVIDVPVMLLCCVCKLSGQSGRKTDAHDARSVVIAAAHNSRLRRVTVENTSVVLGLLLDRRWYFVQQRQRTLCQLHALLGELVSAGAATHLTSKKAAVLLRKITPGSAVELERKLFARELLEEIRWFDKRIPVVKQRLF
jgi:hypothetical protein